MSEFFLELFSEEIPAGLQKNFREKILENFSNLFDENSIKSKKSGLASIFTASLELTKDGIINIMQEKLFSEILIKKSSHTPLRLKTK